MSTDHDALGILNVDIGNAESRGDKAYFEALLAPAFAFRRAGGAVVDRKQFIDAVAASAQRSTTIRSITLLGEARAILCCVVAMDVQGVRKEFDNLRVFVRGDDGKWKLLAWANEAV
jgi:hypothetical protein